MTLQSMDEQDVRFLYYTVLFGTTLAGWTRIHTVTSNVRFAA